MSNSAFQKDSTHVIVEGLALTDFPVGMDGVTLDYAQDRGVTQVFVWDEAITNTKNARLALRQAIGQNLSVAYSKQFAAFSDATKPAKGLRIDTERYVEQGPPLRHKDGKPSMLYQFRDPNRMIDLRPYIGLIYPENIGELFKIHYFGGPNPDPDMPVITYL